MKKEKFIVMLILFICISIVTVACFNQNDVISNSTSENLSDQQSSNAPIINEIQSLTVWNSSIETDLTEGLVANDEFGNEVELKVIDRGGYLPNKIGTFSIEYAATDDIGNTAKYSRDINVTYFGLSKEDFIEKDLSNSAAWSFRNTSLYQTGIEWNRYVVSGHNTNWNRFEESSGLVMNGSDTEGHSSTSIETEDNNPNTILWNKVAVDKNTTTMRIYLSNNPYPEYNNLVVNWRLTAIDTSDYSVIPLTDFNEMKAPLPESLSLSPSWYKSMQYENYVDLDLSSIAGKTVILLIEQDSSDFEYQVDFYRSLGYNSIIAHSIIKETRDTMVIYQIEIDDMSTIIDGMNVKEWSSLAVDENVYWDFETNVTDSSAHTKWKYLNNSTTITGSKTDSNTGIVLQGSGNSIETPNGTLYNKLYLKGDTLSITLNGNSSVRVSMILPTKEVVSLIPNNYQSEIFQVNELETINFDVTDNLSKVVTLLIETFGNSSTVIVKNIKISNVNANILWTIGDSIFHINYDMVSKISASINSALITSNLSGTSITPSRQVDDCMVNLIKNGSWDNLFKDDITPTTIIVQRATNDLYQYYVVKNLEMGAIDSTDENTICGAINYTIKYFKEKFPEANIIWATPTYQINVDEETFMEYNINLKEICNREGIEYFDLYTISGITKSNYNLYLYDGVHPNEEGKQYLTNLWINFLTN